MGTSSVDCRKKKIESVFIIFLAGRCFSSPANMEAINPLAKETGHRFFKEESFDFAHIIHLEERDYSVHSDKSWRALPLHIETRRY